ncbi:MAG: glycoside hydrolase/phage tail family protein [Pseudomonadota bacterium]
MATLVLSAAGLAAGNAIGGSFLGLSTGVLGRFVGATIGRVIDQKILGLGADPVERGKVDRFRLTGASEGLPVAQVYGRARIAGQVIWATQFKESVSTSGGGKGAPKPKVRQYSYSVSLAVALCRGEIAGIGRIWADGQEVAPDDFTLRVYHGSDDQLADALIEAVEGAGNAPSYGGIAYVVLEDVALEPYGNRVPQFNFEVFRPAPDGLAGGTIASDPAQVARAVALIPGTGEYALATTPVHFEVGPGENRSINVNSPSGKPDFCTSLDTLASALPRCEAVSLVVCWFGDDLRAGECQLKPKVEQKLQDGAGMAWRVSGVNRASAEEVPQDGDDRPYYGGTPTDQSVIEAIRAAQEAGQAVTFYPFILMEQLAGNSLPDPWTGASGQPALPWRGRITTALAPGQPGSSDGSAAADAEVAAFFGTAQVSDFAVSGDSVSYTGSAEWSFRRMILHYAHLCAAAGGVEAFCIGSEMRSLTQIRGAAGFPAVAALKALAADVRAILGPGTKISYAADWSEYFGYHPQDGSGDVYFHLDPLWADPNIDFIGIDNYMPLSDWRDGDAHTDADWGSIYDLDYLKANIEGGEGYDWYYADSAARAAQLRTPITDGAHGEPWVYRYKDLKAWWQNTHHERIGGTRQASATDWVPQSKPIWFTEYGCAAIDKGTNQPNKFLDPKSSESALPHYSNGQRDDYMQMQYLRAVNAFYADAANNPVSTHYSGPMVDMDRAHIWAWDTRPYPFFPGLDEVWSDGANFARGHWLNERASARSLQGVVAEIADAREVATYDVSRVTGLLRGYVPGSVDTGRAELQPLMMAYGFDAVERDGVLRFQSRDGLAKAEIDTQALAVSPEAEADLTLMRSSEADVAGRLSLSFIEADGDYETRAEEVAFPDEAAQTLSSSDVPLVLTQVEARGIAERWLSEARVARDIAQFSLPLSQLGLGAGDVVRLEGADYRIDRANLAEFQTVEAVRVERELYTPSDAVELAKRPRPYWAPVPVYPLFMDLPLLRGDETPHAPYLAATAKPWPGAVAVYDAASDAGYGLNTVITQASVIGITQTALDQATPGVLDRGAPLRIKLISGALSSAALDDVLAGANAAAIGDGSAAAWEVIQFTDAELSDEPFVYEISGRLRGQAGTDGVMPASWPVGSVFVLLNSAPQQIELAQANRGLARHYRIGPAQRGYDDAAFLHRVAAFEGVGLRPYAPVHLRAERDAGSDVISWVRRTRVDGDSWLSSEVPLGEEAERYRVVIRLGGSVVREAEVSAPSFVYGPAMRAADGVSGSYDVDVAQVSAVFGPGPNGRIVIDG